MMVTVNFDGQVLDTESWRASGNPTLDRRAQAIARSAGPFGTFTDAMRRKADQIVLLVALQVHLATRRTLETSARPDR